MMDNKNVLIAIATSINLTCDRDVISSIKFMPDDQSVSFIYKSNKGGDTLLFGRIDDTIDYLKEIEKAVIL